MTVTWVGLERYEETEHGRVNVYSDPWSFFFVRHANRISSFNEKLQKHKNICYTRYITQCYMIPYLIVLKILPFVKSIALESSIMMIRSLCCGKTF